MRILIFLLALISAFFVSNSQSTELDYTDLKPPKTTTKHSMGCADLSNNIVFTVQDINATPTQFAPYCASYLLSTKAKKPGGICPPADPQIEYIGGEVRMTQATYKPWYWNDGGFGGCANDVNNNHLLYAQNLEPRITEECPPDNFPKYEYMHSVEGETFCIKEKDPEPACPEPTGNELFVFGTSFGTTSVCYDNRNDLGQLTSQCRIETNEDGSYLLPLKYGSQEPVACKEPQPEPDPEQPDPTPDPEQPDDSPDPDKTPDPEPKPEPDQADDTDKTEPIDALNQVNDNLNTISNNANDNTESHNQRLDRIAKETQNSNELLSSIKQNTSATTNNTGNTLTEIGKSNDLLFSIKKSLDSQKDNSDSDSINFSAGRKKGGLNDIFTDADLAQVEQEIEDKKTELTDYIEKIELESKTIFDINTNISGSYIEHKETIKGAEVDLGMGRFSGFFQIIAPALIFVATIAALFIMLGGNKE